MQDPQDRAAARPRRLPVPLADQVQCRRQGKGRTTGRRPDRTRRRGHPQRQRADHQHGTEQQPHRRLDGDPQQAHCLTIPVLPDEDRGQCHQGDSRPVAQRGVHVDGSVARLLALGAATASFFRGNFDQAEDFLGTVPKLAESRDGRLLVLVNGAYGHRMVQIARTLGRGPVSAFREVHLPLLRPALASAALLVFVDCMKELPATLILRPFDFETLATSVFMLASLDQLEESALPALTIVAVGLLPVILLSRTLHEPHITN